MILSGVCAQETAGPRESTTVVSVRIGRDAINLRTWDSESYGSVQRVRVSGAILA